MNLIFVSSPQTEFAPIRRELCYFILTDPYLKQYFDVFLLENLPANERHPRDIYLNKVEESAIYLGLFGKTYGTTDDDGISSTEYEYNHATSLNKDRFIYIKELSARVRRASKMVDLIRRAHEETTYDTFKSLHELKLKVMQSLLFWQQNHP
jgi:ATP-dependent DNA helicase RecG